MLQQMIDFFRSLFSVNGLSPAKIALAVGIAVVFGVLWLSLYRPSPKRVSLWAILVIAAFLTWTAVAFVQIPLQIWTGKALLFFWSQAVLERWILLAGIPGILLSGLVQEGAKLVPVVLYWGYKRPRLTSKEGLIAGAAAGAGFGVLEAVWVSNAIFASGWTWHTVETYGYQALLGFWERLFTVAFHIAVSAIAGYGLARRWGWQFYLVAAGLHGLVNYAVVLLQSGRLTAVQTEIYVAAVAVVVTGVALALRWRKADGVESVQQQA